MNWRTEEVRRLAPIANWLRIIGLGVLLGMGAASLGKLLGILPNLSWDHVATISGVAFACFLVGRVRMGMINAKLERQLENAP